MSHYMYRLEMTEILLKGRKTLTHPSIITCYAINVEIQIWKESKFDQIYA